MSFWLYISCVYPDGERGLMTPPVTQISDDASKRRAVSYRFYSETFDRIGIIKQGRGVETDTRAVELAIESLSDEIMGRKTERMDSGSITLTTRIFLSEEARKSYFIKNGVQLESEQTVEIPTKLISADSREYVWDIMSKSKILDLIKVKIQLNGDVFDDEVFERSYNYYSPFIPAGPSEWDEYFTKHREFRDSQLDILRKSVAFYANSSLKSINKAIQEGRFYHEIEDLVPGKPYSIGIQESVLPSLLDAIKEYFKGRNDRVNQEKMDKIDWISDFGSDRLRKAFFGGYECERLYLTERAMDEFPDFEVLDRNTTTYVDVSSPSLSALELAEKVNGRVVIMQQKGHDPGRGDVIWNLGEAVILEHWRMGCSLYQIISTGL